MGNSQSTSFGTDPTVHCKRIQSEPGHQIYQSVEGQQYEVYMVPSKNSSIDISYQFRVNNKHPQIVDVFYAGQKDNLINCTSPIQVRVVTERIPYRLAHLPQQHPVNALCLLRQSLLGFKDLFKVNGIMCVKDTMIGLNTKNKVKVWLQPNFALNQPESKNPSFEKLESNFHQRQIVQNIFDLINSKAENHQIWRELMQLKERKQIKSFDQALKFIDGFTSSHRLVVLGTLKNPFNKFTFRDENSQIDKLQELKMNKTVEESKEIQNEYMSPTFQKTILQIEERRGFSDIKNKCINAEPSPARPQTLTRQPFLEIQKRMNINQNSFSLLNRPQIHPITQIPYSFINKSQPVAYSPQPRVVTSVPKNFKIKFQYDGQHSSLKTHQVYKKNEPIPRSSSQCKNRMKPQAVIHLTNSSQFLEKEVDQKEVKKEQIKKQISNNQKQQQISQQKQKPTQIEKNNNEGQQVGKKKSENHNKEETKVLNMFEVFSNTINPSKENEHAENQSIYQSSEALPQDISPHEKNNQSGLKDQSNSEIKEENKYNIKVTQKENQPQQQRKESTPIELPGDISIQKKRSSLLQAPKPPPMPLQKDIFAQIIKMTERSYGLREGKKEVERGMKDSREYSRKGSGSPRNENSGMSSSIMSKSKVPKVSYKEMRKMLLETLGES